MGLPLPPRDRTDPLSALPPRRYLHPHACALVLLTAAATALVSQLAGTGGHTPVLAVAAVFASAGIAAAGIRARHRDRILDDLAETLAPLLGARTPDRRLIRARRWTGAFTGAPQRLTLRHARTINTEDPAWRAQLFATLTTALPASRPRISIAAHTRTTVHLVLDHRPSVSIPAEKATHAVTVLRELFGDTAHIDLTEDHHDVTAFTVKHTHGNTMALGTRRDRIQRILNARIPGTWNAHWDLINDTVRFTRREPLPSLVRPPAEHLPLTLSHRDYFDLEIPYALAEGGEVISWSPVKQSHMLVIGGTGSGKTVCLHRLVQAVTQAGWRTWVIDGKRIEFIGFRDWPNIELLGSKIEHQVRMVIAAHALMEERYRQIEAGEVTVPQLAPMLLVMDEVTTFLKRVDAWWRTVKPKGSPTKAPVLDLLADLARLSRSAKIHLVLGLQRPDVEFLGGEMRDNFGARASLGRLSPQGAQMMWDSPAIGTTLARGTAGRGYACTHDGRILEAQFYLVPNPDPGSPSYSAEETAAVRPSWLLHPPKHIEDLDHTDPRDGHPVQFTYVDYAQARILDGPPPHHTPPPGSPPAPAPPFGEERLTGAEPGQESAHDVGAEPWGEEYSEEVELLPASHLATGDLVEIDTTFGLWGIIEAAEPSDTGVILDYRAAETGEPASLDLDPDATLPVRHPRFQE